MHGMRPAAHESSKPLPAAGAKGGKEHAARLDGAAKTALEHARGQLRVAAGRKVRDVGGGLNVLEPHAGAHVEESGGHVVRDPRGRDVGRAALDEGGEGALVVNEVDWVSARQHVRVGPKGRGGGEGRRSRGCRQLWFPKKLQSMLRR